MRPLLAHLAAMVAAAVILTPAPAARAQDDLIYVNCFNTSTGDVPYLCSLEPDGGGGPVLVTEGLGTYPPVTADGTKILRWEWNGEPPGLYLLDIDGTNPLLVVPQDSLGYISYFDASADGSIVAAITNQGLFTIDAATGAITTVMEGYVGASSGFPKISSDGTRVLYSAPPQGGGGSDAAVWMVPVDGSAEPLQLSDPSVHGGLSGFDLHADWSHDGTFIVYGRHVSLASNIYLRQVRRVEADGTGDTVLFEQTWTGTPPLNIFGVQVAPDGEQAAVLTRQSYNASEPWYTAYTVHTIPTSGGGLSTRFQINYPIETGYVPDHLAQWAGTPAPDDTLVVNTTGDESDVDLEDGVCDVDPAVPGSQCTLRAAIENANHRSGTDIIVFELEGGGPHVIAPESPLPAITDPVELDATSQPGYAGPPLVRLNGAAAGSGTSGLRLATDDSVIKGFSIYGFDQHGILVTGGSGNVLTDLIVGTTEEATFGIGNGGDGIRVEGDASIQIGDQMGSAREDGVPSVMSAGNGGNGVYVRNESGAAMVRAMLADPPSREREISRDEVSYGLGDMGLGMLVSFAGFETVAMPNGQNGLCIVGASGVYVAGVRFGPDPAHGLEALLSAGLTIERCTFGTLERVVVSADQIAGNGDSAISLRECADVIIGSEDTSADPLIGVASEQWFIELSDSERVEIAGILTTALLLNGGEMPPGLLDEMRNEAGGIRVEDSAFTTIGAEGMETIVVNSGGPGIEVSGAGSQGLTIQSAYVGTTPEALTGLGNDGAGVCVRDSVPDFEIGSLFDGWGELFVSAGNSGPGLEIVGLVFGVEQARLVARVYLGLVPDPDGTATEIANGLEGITIEQCVDVLLDDPNLSASDRAGIRIIQSEGITMSGGSIGRLADVIDSPDDVAGPRESGISIEQSSNIRIGDRDDEDGAVEILGAGGYGIEVLDSSDVTIENASIGLPLLDALTPELRAATGNDLGGIRLDASTELQIRGARAACNGSSVMSEQEGRQLYAHETAVIIDDSAFLDDGPTTDEPASDAEVRAVNAALTVIQSRFTADIDAIVADDSQVRLQSSEFWFADHAPAPGELVRLDDGVLEMTRCVLTDPDDRATGDLVVMAGGAQGVLRFNEFRGTSHGVLVEGIPARPIIARENWWGSEDGPGGEGPGSGSAVSAQVDFSDWLTAPLGVLVDPERAAVVVESGADLTVDVEFINLLIDDDTLDVVVHDSQAWLTSPASFTVGVSGGDWSTRALTFTVPADNTVANEVVITAASQADPQLAGEARVRLVPGGNVVELQGPALAGDLVLDAPGQAFAIGDTLVIDPGGAGEEEVVVTDFGSIVLAEPLQFDHQPGALITFARTMDVHASVEDPGIGEGPPTPARVALHPPYPNPFNPMTTVAFELPSTMSVNLVIYDLAGRVVRRLQQGDVRPAGRHEVSWNGRDDGGRTVPAGVYLCRLETEQHRRVQRLTLVK